MKQPNVVVFFTDQQRWDTMGAYGNPCGLTPAFDRMAAGGTCFEYAMTPQPVCGPARAVLQTGKYATTLGTYRNGIPLPRSEKTMAHYFGEAGYHTGYIGKWHLASGRLAVAEEERGGYQYWLGANALEESSQPYNTVVYGNDNEAVKLPGYRVDALTDAAIRYIDDRKENPFFLFLSFLEPHFQNCWDNFPAPHTEQPVTSPYTPPDLAALQGTSPQHLPGYYGMVRRLDMALGRIQDALESLGLAEDTIILFTADHGCHFKTRNAEYKRSCHESSIHIPMALAGGPFRSGGRRRELMSLVDIAPTLLDACGIPVPADMEGNSVMPVLNRQSEDWPDDTFIQISEAEVGRAVRTHKWKFGVDAPDKDPVGDAFADVYQEAFLYDLENDPWELDNLAGQQSHRLVREKLSERLRDRIRSVEGREAAVELLADKPSGQRKLFSNEENK